MPGNVQSLNSNQSSSTTTVKIEKSAAYQNEEIILNPKKHPRVCKQIVADLIKMGLISVKGEVNEALEEVEKAVREVKNSGKNVLYLSDIIDYTVNDEKRLAKELGVVPPGAQDPFEGVMDKAAYNNVMKATKWLKDLRRAIDTTK